jgi:hypothetical protein
MGLTIELPVKLDARLTQEARRRRKSKSALVKEALDAFLRNGRELPTKSFYELTADLCGSLDAPSAPSTNPKYMEEFGK